VTAVEKRCNYLGTCIIRGGGGEAFPKRKDPGSLIHEVSRRKKGRKAKLGGG